tara:strand:+ start:2398 stop:2991 length:594 start_codon:yes stop_codon:yes gene_type:complete
MKRLPTKNRSRWGFSSEGIGRAIKISMTWVGLLWVVEIVDLSSGFQLDGYGILPRKVDGLMGIFWSPLLHADFAHLIANSGPLVLLLIMLFSHRQYRPKSSLAFIWLVSGLGTWLIGRPAIHIGASSIVYGLAAFLMTASFWMRSWRAFFLSILALLMFGGLFYGLFYIQKGVSWEGHLSGALAGVWVAWLMHARHA